MGEKKNCPDLAPFSDGPVAETVLPGSIRHGQEVEGGRRLSLGTVCGLLASDDGHREGIEVRAGVPERFPDRR